MMEFKWIEKYYQDKHLSNYLLRNINFKINDGEFVKIKRPSGNSKSDLLYVFGLLNVESASEYVFYDESIKKMNKKRFQELYNSKVGFIFKKHFLINEFTVYENIEAPLIYQNVNSSERKKRITQILKKFNLLSKKDLFPNQLSRYEQQKVSIARAIISNPKIIVADEPLANLDQIQSNSVMELLSELNKKGTTIVMASKAKYSGFGEKEIHLSKDQIVTENSNEKFYAKHNVIFIR